MCQAVIMLPRQLALLRLDIAIAGGAADAEGLVSPNAELYYAVTVFGQCNL